MSHVTLNESANATPHEPEGPLRGCLLAVYRLALDHGIAKTLRRLRFGKSQSYAGVQCDHTGMAGRQDGPRSSALPCSEHAQATQFLQRLQTTTASAETRDPDTMNHERHVAMLAVAIAQEMKLSEHQVEGIRVAATVHDLGKVQIPAEILNKPCHLDEKEFTLMKTHPLNGYHLLKDIDCPWPIADIVLQHHERFDGSGYPNGLKGKHILLEAQIVAVADTVEAITSHRSYKVGLGIQDALDEITAGSGKSYDPDVVEACVRLFREKKFFLNN
jgi:putative nucleotidyltransferase with HDIG domain